MAKEKKIIKVIRKKHPGRYVRLAGVLWLKLAQAGVVCLELLDNLADFGIVHANGFNDRKPIAGGVDMALCDKLTYGPVR